MSSRRIAVFGGSFNPPGLHHEALVGALVERFDEVILLPCGPRPDKSSTNEVDPVHRATMVDIAFLGRPGVRLELFDLEQATFTPTYELQRRFEGEGEVWYAVGSELVEGGAQGRSAIHSWYKGEEIWRELNFFVLVRPGHAVAAEDLPPRSEVLDTDIEGASTRIRELAFHGRSLDGLVVPRVAEYMRRYGLYRGGLPRRTTRFTLAEPRPHVILDEHNERARQMAQSFDSSPREEANCIVAIGGDGTMLHVIRENWRARLPMLGINAGHRGFLLNDPEELESRTLPGRELILQHLPLLYVEATLRSGRAYRTLAFNDAWVERSDAQTAWIEVRVDGQARLRRLVCDGCLVATAAGSTAYARALGATPFRVDTPELLLVGSNVVEPFRWQSVHLSLESEIEFRGLDTEKRQLKAYADGVLLGQDVQSLTVRKSRIAAVELAFAPEHDLTAKLTELQFPRGTSG